MPEVDVVVVGAGVMGSAAAWRLSGLGRRVALLEQFEIGHDRGSSHGRARVFRFSYDDGTYVRMAMEALPLWREIEADSGVPLLRTTGGLDTGPRSMLERNARALALAGATHQLIKGGEAAERYPMLRLAADEPVLHQGDAGVIGAEQAVRAFAGSAAARGADVRERTRVLGILPAGESVEVRTADESFRASVAVIAAGAWTRPLAEGAGFDLPVTPSRETVSFYRCDDEEHLPILVTWSDHPVYGLPSPGEGLKTGWHHTGPEADPDRPGGVAQDVIEGMAAWVKERYATADPQPYRSETCLYTNTADERFILERRGPVVIGSACSGHGFKFAPLIGDRLARLATT